MKSVFRHWFACAPIALTLASGVAVAQDFDADGIPDSLDICNNTPQGVAVDYWGRPYADFDQDCDVDDADYAFFISGYTGTLDSSGGAAVPGADSDNDGVDDDRDVCDNTPPGVTVDYWGRPYADFDHDCSVDLRDFSFLQDQFTGDLGSCAAGQPCDDGIECTINDICVGGTCMGTPVNSLCDDGAYCNGIETCNPNTGCVAGTPVDCSNLNTTCRRGVCNESTDSCGTTPINNGGACNDGQFCTVGETCQAGACGGGTPRDCSFLSDDCNAGFCDEQINSCVAEEINEGLSCDDGLACSEGATCSAGVCEGGIVDCSYLDDACNIGVCDEISESCEAEPRLNGTLCNDNSVCTIADTCQNGECTGFDLPNQTVCDDGDPSTDETYCVSGDCLEVFRYRPTSTLSYTCGAGGIVLTISSFELVSDGTTIWAFGAPAVMTGDGAIAPHASFALSGEKTVGGCTEQYLLSGQFGATTDTFVGTFQARYMGCGSCGWPSWNNMTFTRQ